jgi:hypothetical protein
MDRFRPARLDEGQLQRHGGRRERRTLTGAGVVERSCDDYVDAVLGHRANRELFLRELAQPVRARRLERGLFVERCRRVAIHRGRAGHEDAARDARPADGVEQIVCREDVAAQRMRRIAPGMSYMRRAGAVIDGRRRQFPNAPTHAVAIEQIHVAS